jgi:hypothetical protein
MEDSISNALSRAFPAPGSSVRDKETVDKERSIQPNSTRRLELLHLCFHQRKRNEIMQAV